MILKPIKKDEIEKRKYSRTDLQGLLSEFMKMDVDAVEILNTNGRYCSTESMYSSFYRAIEISGYAISVIKRGDKVYLIKK